MARTLREELSADDAAILALESEVILGHTLKLLVLESGEPLEVDRLRAAVAARLDGVPRARERVEEGEGRPAWVEDPRFDITAHVREREGSAGLDEAGLWRAAAELMSERLDRGRALWSFDLLGPLADGREAIVARIHHAMADGMSCVRFLEAALWEEAPEPADERARPHPAPAAQRSRLSELRHLPGALLRELGARAPSPALDRPLGSERALAFAAAPLSLLRTIGHSRPERATVNDVLLAGVAGGLREWLSAAGAEVASLRAQIPVSLHCRDHDEGLGNRDSFLNVELPLAEPDPLRRLDRITASTARRKELGDAQELYDFFHAVSRFRPLAQVANRLASSPHEFSLSVSNVPGPRGAIRVLDRRVERLYTIAEPAHRHALRVSAISAGDALAVGLCADPAAVPALEQLAGAIEASFAELHGAAA